MNLICNPWSSFNPAARAWLPGYVRSQFDLSIAMARECEGVSIPLNPWDEFAGSLEVVLTFDKSVDNGDGSGRYASMYRQLDWSQSGFGNWKVNDRIDIAWTLEMASYDLDENGLTRDEFQRYGGHMVLRHEMQHFVGRHAGMEDWGHFGHGNVLDPFIRAQHKKLDPAYHRDVVLRHVRDLALNL